MKKKPPYCKSPYKESGLSSGEARGIVGKRKVKDLLSKGKGSIAKARKVKVDYR